MAGSDDDGRTALNFRTFMKKTGIERRSKHVPPAADVAVDPDAVEDDGDVIVEEDQRWSEEPVADQSTPFERTSLG